MAVLHITKQNFEKEVLMSNQPVLVDFWAAWCGPCQMLSPTIEQLADEVSNVKVCKINVDEETELAQKFNIMTIPTLLFIKGGQVTATSIGVKSKAEILEMLNIYS